jgi:hypothetical protein
MPTLILVSIIGLVLGIPLLPIVKRSLAAMPWRTKDRAGLAAGQKSPVILSFDSEHYTIFAHGVYYSQLL